MTFYSLFVNCYGREVRMSGQFPPLSVKIIPAAERRFM